jgi:hypothetical protein
VNGIDTFRKSREAFTMDAVADAVFGLSGFLGALRPGSIWTRR